MAYNSSKASVEQGKDLVINDMVYNSFVFVTLGSFGIAGAEKIMKK